MKYIDRPHGVKPRKIRDRRNYSFHKTFGSLDLSFLNVEMSNDAGLTMPDQIAEGLPLGCTGETTAELGIDFDGIRYLPEFTYRKTCAMEGHPMNQGCYIYNSLKSGIIYGLAAEGEDESKSFTHLRGPAFFVEQIPGYDWFDTIRSTLLLNKKRSISAGTPWYAKWSAAGAGNILTKNSDGTYTLTGGGIKTAIMPMYDSSIDPLSLPWHNWKLCGITRKNGVWYIIGKTWNGREFGDMGGFTLWSREQINSLFSMRGCEMWTQAKASPEDIKTITLPFIESILSYLQNMWNKAVKIISLPKLPPLPLEPITPPPAPTPEPPVAKKYYFDTPTAARHSIRVLCDEAGLSWDNKNVITAVIQAESGFKNTAVNYNRLNGRLLSTDWGICQINDYWHIGPKKTFPSVDYVIQNPDKVVQFMIQMLKAGKLNLWVAYSTGAYKKYMPK